MATYQELRARSQQVRDEQNIGGNTALRVGQLLMDIVKYFNDNDEAASEHLQQHFAMVNDGTQLLNWQQSPIVILYTMGETYDDGDSRALSQGENYYRAGFIMEANGHGGGINGETPKANVLYVNLANDTLYTWNGSSFDAITSGGGGVSVSYNASTKTTNIVVGAGASAETTPTPVISVSDVNDGKQVTITAATGAVIRYTTDGSGPTSSSPVYSSPITINTAGTHTIKAVAKVSGKLMSDVATETVTLAGTEQPTITTSETASAVTVTATLAGATVYISTDGETWTSGSGSASLTISKTSSTQQVTVYAYAKQNGYVDSAQVTKPVTVPASGGSASSNIFSGMSTSPVEAITINGTTYTDIENTAVNGGYEWSIDFRDTEFGTITYDGTSTTSIFTDGETDQRANITGISQMPDSWTIIGAYALYCANCTSANIGTKVTSILANAFYNTGITDIVVPDTVNSIAANSFRSAKPHTIYVGSHSIGGVAFIPTADNASKLTSITFGPSVSQIGNSPFGSRAFTNLTTATFLGSTPPTVTSDANLFGTSQADGFKIIVPKGSKSAYESVLTSWTSVIEEAE